jgi:acetolactate synthase-1/2/3 large subunit
MAVAFKLERKENLTGGAIISRMLQSEGVKKVFGIIDGTYQGMVASLGDHGIDLVGPRHEACSVHMAGAYARVTGELGVCMASNGPGVANALSGVAVEEVEGNRVLLITSCRRTGIVYPDRGGTFQAFDQVGVIGKMSKWSCAVPSVDRLPELLRRALRESFTGRPGVVHLDVPESIMNTAVEVADSWFREPEQYRQLEPLSPTTKQVNRALEMLSQAKRPMLHVGSGVVHAQAYAELLQVAELFHAPITTTWGARAVVDERHELSVAMPYVDAITKTRTESDCVLVLGSRLGETDFWGKAPYWAKPEDQQLIQIDTDLEQLGNNRPVDLLIQADVKEFMRQLAAVARSRNTGVTDARKKWVKTLNKACDARRKKLDKHLEKKMMPMHPAHVAPAVDAVCEDDAVFVVDGGNTSIWAHFFHQVKAPNTVLGTPKMGMLGAGIPQAIAAKAAAPDKQVFCLIGDGAMGFHPQEVETAVREGLQVIWLVLCDRQWGMVKMTQQFAMKPIKTLVKKTLSPEENINTDLDEIEFDQLARSMGAHGERVADAQGLPGAIERSLASGKPAVIHVDVDRVAHLWAPNLKTFKDMHQEPQG